MSNPQSDEESSEEEDEATMAEWCTFDDFDRLCSPELTLSEKKENWVKFVGTRAQELIHDASSYMVRNRRYEILSKEDGLFTDVAINQEDKMKKQ